MWFNGKSLSERRPYESRKFVFTDKECRELQIDKSRVLTAYSDALCKNLSIRVFESGYNSYIFHNKYGSKTIGNCFSISVKEAREIVKNIQDNLEEYKQELPNIKTDLFTYFKRNGFFPHQPKGTEVIISDENASLKKKIKDLQAEIEELKQDNKRMAGHLLAIRKIVCVDFDDLEVND